MFHTIRWKLIISSLLAISIPLVILGIVLANFLWQSYRDMLGRELRAKAFIIADAAAPILSPSTRDDPLALAKMVDQWRSYSDVRVTIADVRGIVRAAPDAADVGTPITEERRPGMLAALAGRQNSTVWKNPQFGGQDTMYTNVPVREGNNIIGAVRVAYTLTEIQRNISRVRFTLQASFVLYALLITVLTVRLATSIVRPVEELTRSAQRLGAGDLAHRVHVKGTVEITHLGNTLNQMTERLQQLEGLRRQYVSNVSHELRTPLAAIRGLAETLVEHGESDPALQARYLPRIITQTDRLARLATQLLDLAQIESGNLTSFLGPVSLASVAEEVAQTCTEPAREKNVELQVDVPAELPAVQADRDRLVQVFLNLIDNAVRHTPSGGRVSLRARQAGETVEATIQDTGEGIPAEHLPHIFDRFYRVEQARTRKTGGTGLGLAIVRQIVESHGGSITVRSAPEEGTEFRIVLPLSRQESEAPRADRAPTMS